MLSELHRAGLYVFAVAATLFAIWLGAGAVGFLIILAFMFTFAGSSKNLPAAISVILKYLKGGA